MSAERGKADTSAKGPVTREESPLSFGAGLLASKPRRPEGTGTSSVISTGLHVVFMGALVWGTVGSGIERIEDEVTVMEITQEMEAPPPPPPPPVDQPNAPFQGFQTLSVPDIVPAEIPPPGEVAFRAADFTGQGVQGGNAAGTEAQDAVVAIGDVPSFTPFTVAPVLRNRSEVGRALEREYPQLLRDAGVGGQCEVWIRISESGAVQDVQINNSSGHTALDQAALRVGRTMNFSPAMNRDKQVPVWVSIPITFQVR
jgi:protein TonB